jgi:hypothetical protein
VWQSPVDMLCEMQSPGWGERPLWVRLGCVWGEPAGWGKPPFGVETPVGVMPSVGMVSSGHFKSARKKRVWLGQVSLGCVRVVRLGQIALDRIRLGWVKLG